MYGSAQHSSGLGQGAKIAIPRLDRGPPPPPTPEPSARNKDDRVIRACKKCRMRKIKCTGDGPPCSACSASSLECVYEQGRRDRLKEATQHNTALIDLLRDLSLRADSTDQAKIDDALAEYSMHDSREPDSAQSSLGKHVRRRTSGEEAGNASFGEAYITASAGSNEDLDYLDENISRNRESRETGYFGQNSEVQWLSSVQRQTAHRGAEPYGQPYGPPGSGSDAAAKRSNALHARRGQDFEHSQQAPKQFIADSTFYLDSNELDFDIVVDADELPQFDVAERLLNCYMDTVHYTFPLVSDDFTEVFYAYMNARNGGAGITPVWRAQLNLVFAIGAKYSHAIDAEWAADPRDHLIYMKRAVHLLGLKDTLMIISSPEVPTVQALGLLAFFFLTIGRVSRAWITIGISIRLALALGLHLRNENPNASNSNKEALVRLWWALHSIESLISTVTGRPPILAVEDATVPLPQSLTHFPSTTSPASAQGVSEHSSLDVRASAHDLPNPQRSSLRDHQYLIDHVNLMRILQKALTELYSPRTAVQSWQVIQQSMAQLLKTLDVWSHAISFDDFLAQRREQGADLDRQRRLLVTEYWSIKMVITRPCLCRIERRIKNESNTSAHFNISIAETCVRSALEMAKLFPDQPNLQFLAIKCPWWATTHYMVQAIAVLLLETSYQMRDHEQTTPEIIEAIRKMLRWLQAMEDNDPVAAKAYKVVRRILETVAPILQTTADELLAPDLESSAPLERGFDRQTDHTQVTETRDFPSYDQFQADQAAGDAAFDLRAPHQEVPEPMSALPSDMIFDPSAFLQHSTIGASATSTAEGSGLYSGSYYENLLPIGNLFYTSFDQDTLFPSQQGPWMNNPAPGTFDSEWPNMNEWGEPEQEYDAEMGDNNQSQ